MSAPGGQVRMAARPSGPVSLTETFQQWIAHRQLARPDLCIALDNVTEAVQFPVEDTAGGRIGRAITLTVSMQVTTAATGTPPVNDSQATENSPVTRSAASCTTVQFVVVCGYQVSANGNRAMGICNANANDNVHSR